MNSILKRPVIVGAVIGAAGLVAVVLALSLSGGSDPTAGATTTSSPAAAATSGHKGGSGSRSTTGAAQAWHNLAQCFRGHGYPIADPTVNADGTSSWSSSGSAGPSREVGSATRAVGKTTCRAEFDALPTQTVQPPSTQAERHGLVLFARCMRDHGIADFPDPNSEGAFALNARLLALGKHGADKQLRACSHFNLGKGIVLAGGPATTN